MERYKDIIPGWEAFLSSLERPLPIVIRTNTLRITPGELRRRLEARGFQVSPLPWYEGLFQVEGDIPIGNTLEHWLGYYYVQEATQTLPVLALAPRPGERVLDLCAAPGGKATQIAQHMRDEGLVVANDPSPKRLRALLANLYRLGVRCAVVTECLGEKFPGEGEYDRVLVDAPCSGEGTVRRHPHLRKGAPLGLIRRLASLQKKLLCRALQLVRPGGIVVYSTCTLAPEENEGVVRHALDQGLGRLIPWEPPVPHARGLPGFGKEEYGQELKRAVRLYPHHFDSEGGFIAVFRRPN
ncbi:MAG TPA: RsmB/NOP family class I SAM-dependent RNA methyltransferase [Candidatus Acetothermia bacterium]|nr:RsmB/NOP family class I SAM-dependent RNA methyltransferase [Candidatus Acetothermia bacterium]